jgi:hypothetical protein
MAALSMDTTEVEPPDISSQIFDEQHHIIYVVDIMTLLIIFIIATTSSNYYPLHPIQLSQQRGATGTHFITNIISLLL